MTILKQHPDSSLTAIQADQTLPTYVHLPMILNQDGQKLSKRHGACGVLEFKQQGFLPEAVLNAVLRLGFGHGDQEFFTLTDMLSCFNLRGIGKSGARFDIKKLAQINQKHLQNSSAERLHQLLQSIDPSFLPKTWSSPRSTTIETD